MKKWSTQKERTSLSGKLIKVRFSIDFHCFTTVFRLFSHCCATESGLFRCAAGSSWQLRALGAQVRADSETRPSLTESVRVSSSPMLSTHLTDSRLRSEAQIRDSDSLKRIASVMSIAMAPHHASDATGVEWRQSGDRGSIVDVNVAFTVSCTERQV